MNIQSSTLWFRIISGASILLYVACSGSLKLINEPNSKTTIVEIATPEKKIADSLWELRGDPLIARQAAKAYAQAAKKDKVNPLLLAKLSRAYFLIANYIEQEPLKKDITFRKGCEAAEKAIEMSPGYSRIYANSKDEIEAIQGVEVDYIDAVFWYTANLGKRIVDKNIAVRRGNQEKLMAYNKRILELNENYFYGAPHRFFGAIMAKIEGGDLQVAQKHFLKAFKIAPDYLGAHNLYAEYYAVRAQDKTLFLEQVNYVLNANADIVADIAPENHYEQEVAKKLIQQVDKLFPVDIKK